MLRRGAAPLTPSPLAPPHPPAGKNSTNFAWPAPLHSSVASALLVVAYLARPTELRRSPRSTLTPPATLRELEGQLRLTRPLLNSLPSNSSALRPVAFALPPSAPAQPTTHPMPLLLPPRLAAAQGLALLVTSSQSSVAPSLPLPPPASCIAGLSLTRDKRSVPQSRTDPLCRAQYAALPEFSKARYSIAPSIAWPRYASALLLTHSFGTQLQPPLRFHQGHCVTLMYATLRIPQTTVNHNLRSPARSCLLRLCSLRTQTGAGAKSGPQTHGSSPSLRPATALPSLCPQQPQRPPSPLPRYDGLLVRRRDIGQIGPHASVAWKIPNSLDFPPPA